MTNSNVVEMRRVEGVREIIFKNFRDERSAGLVLKILEKS